jgi:hypothetical protein
MGLTAECEGFMEIIQFEEQREIRFFKKETLVTCGNRSCMYLEHVSRWNTRRKKTGGKKY